MKKQLTKIMATALSVAMVAANPLTVLANTDTEVGANVQANILAFKADTFVVPTDVKLALNPQHFDVVVDSTSRENVEALTDDAEIISLTYGVANLSTSAKNLEIKVDVSDANGINFISAAETEEWRDLNEDEEVNDGEIISIIDDRSDYAISLQLDTAFNTADGANANNVKKNEIAVVDDDPQIVYGRVTSVIDEDDVLFTAESAADYNASHDGANKVDGDNALGCYLSNVAVTTGYNGGSCDFALAGNTVTAKSDIYLYEAEYENTQPIDYNTTQQTLANNNMVLDELGGIAAFTFSGVMNSSVDWTAAGVSHQITLTPTYKFTDVADVLEGGYLDVAYVYEGGINRYEISLPIAIDDIAAINNFKVNDIPFADIYTSNDGRTLMVDRVDVAQLFGNEWAGTNVLTFTFTLENAEFISAIGREGAIIPHN